MNNVTKKKANPSRRQDVCTREFDSETALYDPVLRHLHRLNLSAGLVWRELHPELASEEVVRAVADAVGLTPAEVEEDVLEVINQLWTLGLLEESPASPPVPLHPAPAPAKGIWGATRPNAALHQEVVRASSSLRFRCGPFGALGSWCDVTTDDEDLATYLESTFASLQSEASSDAVVDHYVIRRRFEKYRLTCNGSLLRDCVALDRAAAYLGWHMNRRASDRYSTDSFGQPVRADPLLHASAVARDGGALLMPAVPNAGKSTLAAGLVQAGWEYLTDEAVSLDGDGLIPPYPKPVGIEPGSQGALASIEESLPTQLPHQGTSQWLVPPEAIRLGSIAGVSVSLAWIVTPEYQEDAPTTVESLEPPEVLALLLANCFHLDPLDFPRLVSIAESIPSYRLVNGDLQAACEAIDELAHR